MLVGERDCPGCESLAQAGISAQFQNRIHDAQRIDLIQHPGVFTVADKPAKIGAWKDNGTARGKKLGEFARQSEFVEGIVAAGLNKGISQAEKGRDFLVRDVAEIDRDGEGPFLVRPQERTKVAPGPNKTRGRAFSVKNSGGDVKASHVASIGGMDVARVAKHDRIWRNAERFQLLWFALTGEKEPLTCPRPKNEFWRIRRHKPLQRIHD